MHTHTHTTHTFTNTQEAIIARNEKYFQTLSVNGVNRKVACKLRTVAKERQHWISQLRMEVKHCTNESFRKPIKKVESEGGEGVCVG